MARKGRLYEIFSKATHADDSTLYTVGYRDFENIVEVNLKEFLRLSENFELIPPHRVIYVKKENRILYRKHGY